MRQKFEGTYFRGTGEEASCKKLIGEMSKFVYVKGERFDGFDQEKEDGDWDWFKHFCINLCKALMYIYLRTNRCI